MDGDERRRFCFACSKEVYDLLAMTEDEAESFLAVHLDDGDECVRLFRRPDGRVLTTDCPVGATRRHRARAALGVAVGALVVAGVAALVGDLHVPHTHSVARETHSRFEPPRPTPNAPVRLGFAAPDVQPPYDYGTWRQPPLGQGQGWGNVDLPEPGLMGFRDPPVPRQRPTPTLRQGAITVTGDIPPEVIARIVRQSFGRFRLCYENGLRSNPGLEGTVVTNFVIGRDGSVVQSGPDTPAMLHDDLTVGCIMRAFANLSFPTPERGPVKVRFPITFSPGE